MFYEQTVLSNGVTVVSEHMDAVRSVALGFWVRVGNRDESPEVYGISHFMEHMLFKGTPTRSAIDISTEFDAIGAELNAFTSREYTCFHARMMDEHLPKAFEILSDMVVNAAFTPETMTTEREVVLEEIARSEDTPDDYVFDVLSDAMYPTHPLGRPILGSKNVVASLGQADMVAYHKAHYTTGNLTVVACGNVDHELLVKLAEQWLEDLPVGERLARNDAPEANRSLLGVHQKDCEQAHITLGFPAMSTFDPRRYACFLMDAAMGGGMSSRLFTEIREKRGLVYSVFTTVQTHTDAGQFLMYAGTRPENISQILSVAADEFDKMRAKGIQADELARCTELTCGNIVLSMESTRNHMVRLGRAVTQGITPKSLDEVLDSYRSVTIDQVNEVAEELLAQKPTMAVVSPHTKQEIEEMI